MDVIFHRDFKKQFKKLPVKIQKKFEERLNLFLNEPDNSTLNNHSVEKAYPKSRSINITGDYRAIYQKDEDLICFMIIGTHSELYS
ncbi:MAG: Uncharacterized protein G01um101418_130 [Parcubacteria group bacterium Gr01-1014_18]|nr:MAG: Uncharacterized protein Greene041636_434 [Parcubacteria group bacterium Greene0416_36]TSC81457.1 MAG: Uncharacterized protein G01um101418_130 [Parcubacteria group bacterium Gr01-1014_18]TSC99055.1 MAG: Uncharacterized protein Greene101420_411 [Parcubacteria group bacterium Greene1014_20]TSD07264.1 MAG: Uncharacterized protein Greene07142_280 [Parcubacteria group bacterium Greene0714_2]